MPFATSKRQKLLVLGILWFSLKFAHAKPRWVFTKTAAATLNDVVAGASHLGLRQPARAVEIFGEVAVSFVRLDNFDRAEEVIQALIALLPKIVEKRSRAKAAAEVAVQIAKAGTIDERCYAWAERLVQLARDVCRAAERSTKAVREPGQVWRVEALLIGAAGRLDEAEAKARRNSHTEPTRRFSGILRNFVSCWTAVARI